MHYFQTSWQTIQRIAQATGRFEDVAGFLVLARHATGKALAGYPPYRFSGAGVNSVHEKAGMSEEAAQAVIDRLRALGVIRPAPAEVRCCSRYARWEVMQGELDLALPHAFVDSPKMFSASTPLRRLRTAVACDEVYAERLENVDPAALRLDALMVMLGIYRHTSMKDYGGLDPACVYRHWGVPHRAPQGAAMRWESEPEHRDSRAWPDFQRACMAHALRDPQAPELSHEEHHRFWNAFYSIERMGLVYEAVALFDGNAVGDGARLQFTLRINDYHAGAVSKDGDPCLLRNVEVKEQSARLGCYHPPGVRKDDEGNPLPEGMWVVLPQRIREGALVGIWRPRFRASTPDVGAWLHKENAAIGSVAESLMPTDPWSNQW